MVALVLTAIAALFPVAVAAQGPVTSPPVGGEPIDPDATAVLQWSVPERYDLSWGAWNARRAKYDADFVTPKSWSINLDACSSRAVQRVERYTFVVTGTSVPNFQLTSGGPSCKRTIEEMPALGLYRVETTLHTALGASVTLSSIVELQDYLIVSVGDSLSSGEGVPDEPGVYEPILGGDHLRTIKRVQWKDRRCHRSAFGGPAVAAQAIEGASQKTSVTFISLACSGADLKHLDTVSYAGAESPPAGTPDLPPQIPAVAQLLASEPAHLRQIDALLITGGINDVGFSSIVGKCATNNNRRKHHTDCVFGSNGAHLVNTSRFAARYDLLASSVRQHLPSVREIYISGYPSEVFRGGACDALGGVVGRVHVPGLGIDRTEGNAMNTMGVALNRQVQGITTRHRDEGWNYIEDPTTPFAPHRYCGDEPWFNHLEHSLLTQGDVGGTAHPNREGHRAFARLIGRSVVPDQPEVAFRDITLTIDAVKLTKTGGRVSLTLSQYPRDPVGISHAVNVLGSGVWTPVAAELGTFEAPVFREPASPRHATGIQLELARKGHPSTLGVPSLVIRHGFADGYGLGSHELTRGDIAVRYHIDVLSPRDGDPVAHPGASG